MANYFAKNLKFLRQKYGMSKTELASKLKVNQSTISRWENNEMGATVENAYDASIILNVPISDLVGKDLQNNNTSTPSSDEEYKQILKDKGLMDENNNINPEDFKKLVDFAVANKDFIIKKDRD